MQRFCLHQFPASQLHHQRSSSSGAQAPGRRDRPRVRTNYKTETGSDKYKDILSSHVRLNSVPIIDAAEFMHQVCARAAACSHDDTALGTQRRSAHAAKEHNCVKVLRFNVLVAPMRCMLGGWWKGYTG